MGGNAAVSMNTLAGIAAVMERGLDDAVEIREGNQNVALGSRTAVIFSI